MVKHSYSLLDEEKIVERGSSKTCIYFDSFMCKSLLVFIIILVFILHERTKFKNSRVFQAFHDCVYPKLEPFKGKYEEFWHAFTNLTIECDSLEVYNALEIRPALNSDEVKYVALPKKNESLTMVTLGIGHDVGAEIKLKELHPNTIFFGADPSSDINKDLYENQLGGSYYKYAVSGQSGMQNSRVFEKKEYEEEIVGAVGADYFFKNILHKNKIDILWIDIEGNEYSFIDQIHRNGSIDREGVKICQMNVEMHKGLSEKPAGEMENFHDFVWKILDDRKYILMKPFYVKYMHFRFIRVFILNVADKECTDLYL